MIMIMNINDELKHTTQSINYDINIDYLMDSDD